MTVEEQIIGGYSTANAPGVLALYLIEKSDVLSVLDPFRHILPGQSMARVPFGGIVLRTSAKVYKMKFPPLACSFSQSFDRSDGGLIINSSIGFAIPASRLDIAAFFNTHYQKQWVCLLEDANRQAYILGNEERGLRMAMAQAIGSTNSHTVSLTGKSTIPALILETSVQGLVLAEQFPDTDFSIDFSLDFNG